MQRPSKHSALPVVIAAFAILFVVGVARQSDPKEPSTYSQFLAQVESGGVEKVRVDAGNNRMAVTPKQGDKYETAHPDNTEQNLVDRLRAAQVAVEVKPKSGRGIWGSLI